MDLSCKVEESSEAIFQGLLDKMEFEGDSPYILLGTQENLSDLSLAKFRESRILD